MQVPKGFYEIFTAAEIRTANGTVRASTYKNVMDISFKNVGTQAATITVSGCALILDQNVMKSLGGYPGCVRNDEIAITFAGGVGTAIVEVYFTLLKEC